MSVLVVVAVRDSAVKAYGRPIFVPSVGVALRSFSDEVNREAAENAMNMHPSDFELFEIAAFDEDTGVFRDAPEGVRSLARGKDVFKGEVR